MQVDETCIMPLLETPRLMLRPILASDVDEPLHIFANPKVMASFGETPFRREQMEQRAKRNLKPQDARGYGIFCAILKSKGILLATAD